MAAEVDGEVLLGVNCKKSTPVKFDAFEVKNHLGFMMKKNQKKKFYLHKECGAFLVHPHTYMLLI